MTTSQLSADVFDRFANRDGFLGFGYIGERRNTLEGIRSGEIAYISERFIAEVDLLVLRTAETRGWDEDRLFTWANSKDGRWFADVMFGGRGTFADRHRSASRYL